MVIVGLNPWPTCKQRGSLAHPYNDDVNTSFFSFQTHHCNGSQEMVCLVGLGIAAYDPSQIGMEKKESVVEGKCACQRQPQRSFFIRNAICRLDENTQLLKVTAAVLHINDFQ